MKAWRTDQSNLAWSNLATIGLVILVVMAAAYALHTSHRNYLTPQPANPKAIPAVPSGNETSRQLEGLQTAPSSMINGSSSTQLQTGSSSVQQAPANTPQNAGASNPADPDYCSRYDYRGFTDCANPAAP